MIPGGEKSQRANRHLRGMGHDFEVTFYLFELTERLTCETNAYLTTKCLVQPKKSFIHASGFCRRAPDSLACLSLTPGSDVLFLFSFKRDNCVVIVCLCAAPSASPTKKNHAIGVYCLCELRLWFCGEGKKNLLVTRIVIQRLDSPL